MPAPEVGAAVACYGSDSSSLRRIASRRSMATIAGYCSHWRASSWLRSFSSDRISASIAARLARDAALLQRGRVRSRSGASSATLERRNSGLVTASERVAQPGEHGHARTGSGRVMESVPTILKTAGDA